MPCFAAILPRLRFALYLWLAVASPIVARGAEPNTSDSTSSKAAASREWFEARIRPVLIAQCYECHNSAKQADGKLALDHRAGLLDGGEGGAIVVPGKPAESRLLAILRHEVAGLEMPQNGPQLAARVIADFEAWIAAGAFDPRDKPPTAAELAQASSSEAALEIRRAWWSLQPLGKHLVPDTQDREWSDHPVDRFILAKLESHKLRPASEADSHALLRRLSFALTGLPPTTAELEAFLNDSTPDAYERAVDRLLNSPHFGERWARHWMDVVHYADTHGYEWDTPAKNAWMYRDYLVRSINADVPFNQLILEQLAGDLLPPRVDSASGLNEAMIGPMALRLGERRHGDNASAEGVTQEAMANIIDTIGKGMLATTIACSQCHDHKFDAVPQTDYYALMGVFMSTRWGARCADAVDPNEPLIDELRGIKQAIRAELAQRWLASRESIVETLLAWPPPDEDQAKTLQASFPTTIRQWWLRQIASPVSRADFLAERQRRVAANRANLQLWADFTRPDGAAGWRWEGFGLKHGLARDGEPVIAIAGDRAIEHLLPAGRWSHVWSPRLAGALRSPQFDFDATAPCTFSVEYAGGKYAARSFIIDQAFHSERMAFLAQPLPVWLTLTAGGFDKLAGGIDAAPRRVYWELVTKSLNNYFPPRTGYGGVSEAEAADPSSWFGATRVYKHRPGAGPQDELGRFVPLVPDGAEEPLTGQQRAARLAGELLAAVERWRDEVCSGEDVALLNDALATGCLSNDADASPELAALVKRYREVEARLQPDRTIGSADDWNEGRNERLALRGSYVDFGDEVERCRLRLFGDTGDALIVDSEQPASGRLELARFIASDSNPLTARVFVNRLWLQLFGEGLVRTPDDFGHLGEQPTHPELLDWLSARFFEEGWSIKRQIRLLVTSRAWKQSGQTSPAALTIDAENRLWHHRPPRRLDAEAIRDSLLTVSGRLDPQLGGAPIDPYRAAEDPAKRLLRGPLDGLGRRSLYLKMTLMEPPKFLAIFNQPIPKLTTGKRDTTNVPDQALAMLNDPFVVAMARHWSERLLREDRATSVEQRAAAMLYAAFGRPPTDAEIARLVGFTRRCAELRGGPAESLLEYQPAWQDAAHAVFNAKEFVYVH